SCSSSGRTNGRPSGGGGAMPAPVELLPEPMAAGAGVGAPACPQAATLPISRIGSQAKLHLWLLSDIGSPPSALRPHRSTECPQVIRRDLEYQIALKQCVYRASLWRPSSARTEGSIARRGGPGASAEVQLARLALVGVGAGVVVHVQ